MTKDDMQYRMKTHEDSPMPTAEEVAYDIMNNVHTEHDIFEWKYFDSFYQGELIAGIIAEIASFEADKSLSLLQNRSERLSNIESLIRGHLTSAAKKEGF